MCEVRVGIASALAIQSARRKHRFRHLCQVASDPRRGLRTLVGRAYKLRAPCPICALACFVCACANVARTALSQKQRPGAMCLKADRAVARSRPARRRLCFGRAPALACTAQCEMALARDPHARAARAVVTQRWPAVAWSDRPTRSENALSLSRKCVCANVRERKSASKRTNE